MARSCRVFIGQMRLISRKEIGVLCVFYTQAEELRRLISTEETEIMLSGGDESKSVQIHRVEKKLVAFNDENLELLKSLAENDVSRLLGGMRDSRGPRRQTSWTS